jgi:hypothetical protein
LSFFFNVSEWFFNNCYDVNIFGGNFNCGSEINITSWLMRKFFNDSIGVLFNEEFSNFSCYFNWDVFRD